MREKMPKKSVRKRESRGATPMRLRTYALMLICGLLLLSGFFFAGRQHFSSMDYGMKNSRLRKQVDELEAEKRRLLLAREVSLSPGEIKKAAKKTGLTDPAAASVIAQVTASTKEKAVPSTVAEPKSLVIKTGASSTTVAKVVNAYAKTEKSAKPVRSSAN